MPACKIRKVELDLTPKSDQNYSIQDLKTLIRLAISDLRRTMESEIESSDMEQKSQSISWEFVVWYIDHLQIDPKPIFPDKNQLLWDMLDDIEIASILVRSGVSFACKLAEDKKTVLRFLHLLCASSDPEKHDLAVLMIENGAALSDCDDEGNMPLHVAVKSEAFVVIKAILVAHQQAFFQFFPKGYDKFVELALRSPSFKELLTLFCEYSKLDIYHCCNSLPWDMSEEHLVSVIMTLVEIASRTMDNSYVQYIIRHVLSKNFELGKILFGLKPNGNEKSFNVQTLLAYDFISDYPAMILCLLREGANVNEFVDDYMQYPLHIACARYKQDIVELLLRLGADMNVTDRLSRTPFSMYIDGELYTPTLCSFSKVIIKHFACLTSLGRRVNEYDLSLMRERPNLQKFYKSCIKELNRIKTFDAGFLYYNLFEKSSYELTSLMRNNGSFRQLRKQLLGLLPNTFPIFEDDMMQKFKLARDMRNVEVDREREINNTFSGILPNKVASKIARFSLDHVDVEFIMSRSHQ